MPEVASVRHRLSELGRAYPRQYWLMVAGMVLSNAGGSLVQMTPLSMVILTIGELVVVPVASKFVADLAPPDLRGRYMSVYWLGWAASRGAAPLIGGFINDRIAPIAIWYALSSSEP